MKFFVPFTPPEMAEKMYQSLRGIFPAAPSQRRIFRIEYQKEFENYVVQVGEIEPRYGGLVFAILEYGDIFVAAHFEGEINKGKPKLAYKPNTLTIGREDVLRLVEFEEGLHHYPLKTALQNIKRRKKMMKEIERRKRKGK